MATNFRNILGLVDVVFEEVSDFEQPMEFVRSLKMSYRVVLSSYRNGLMNPMTKICKTWNYTLL